MGGGYAFEIHEQLFIKRIRRQSDGVQIISDNPLYGKDDGNYASHDIKVAGQVIWCGQEF